MAGYKRTARDLGAFICFEDEAGLGLRPPKGGTWDPRGARPVVKVRGAGGGRVSIAGAGITSTSTWPRSWQTSPKRIRPGCGSTGCPRMRLTLILRRASGHAQAGHGQLRRRRPGRPGPHRQAQAEEDPVPAPSDRRLPGRDRPDNRTLVTASFADGRSRRPGRDGGSIRLLAPGGE